MTFLFGEDLCLLQKEQFRLKNTDICTEHMKTTLEETTQNIKTPQKQFVPALRTEKLKRKDFWRLTMRLKLFRTARFYRT